ncbi:ROK family protein [Cytophagaceae bacterium ABcell3]|nr:ROK family protein [Cytophagaceae bacterium ABcell3]
MILGIDIGGTYIKTGLVNEQGEISASKKIPTPEVTADNKFTENLLKVIKDFQQETPGIRGVGIGFPGLLDQAKEKVLFLPNIPNIGEVSVVPYLTKELNLPVRIENDANCAALGEYIYGTGKENMLLMTLGTGIGSGAVINGKLFTGGRGNGMEAGHIVGPGGKTIEEHIGTKGIISNCYAQIQAAQGKSSLAGKEITPKMIYDAALEKDDVALHVLKNIGHVLGEAIVTIVRILDVDQILIGGGIAAASEFIVPEAKEVLKTYLPPYYTDSLIIEHASLKNEAGVLGAAALIADVLGDKPGK